MQKNILEWLFVTEKRYPNKIAFSDGKSQLTFSELRQESESIGSFIISKMGCVNRPIVVFLRKNCKCIASFLGIVASGNYYCPIDYDMPFDRIKIILDTLKPIAIITDEQCVNKTEQFASNIPVFKYDNISSFQINQEEINRVVKQQIDTDPLYVLFTSGSTGNPKGVVICHKAVIDYIDWVTETFEISENDVFANQAPFYFDNSILDIYSGIKTGATIEIIPKKIMMFPYDLMKYLNEKAVTVTFWVPSLMCTVANSGVLDHVIPVTLKKALFCGEVMPNKQLNIWRRSLPNILYANLYGPTEITDVCTYYIVDREFDDDESLPIGKPCRNTRIIILDENNKECGIEEEGELCVIGTSIALGYYSNINKSDEVFVQNPLNEAYREYIYRTGDIVKLNSRNEIMYICRKDFQIKHMGNRIELGEIETAIYGVQGVRNCACVYSEEKQKIILFYTGNNVTENEIVNILKTKLPVYMIPGQFIRIEDFTYNSNGKIDRKALLKSIKEDE